MSWTTNVRAWYLGMPFITRSVFTICTALYILCLLTGFNGPDLAYVCISASKIFPGFQCTH